MKLFQVTITGADHSLEHPKELLNLSEEFCFVEWGILYSQTKQGDFRYPTQEWQDKLFAICDLALDTHGWVPSLSAHLCSEWAIDFLFNDMLLLPSKHFKRVQINTTQANFQKADFEKLNALLDEVAPHIEIIFQYRGGPRDNAKVAEMSQYNVGRNRFAAIYDTSGGNSKLPADWCLPMEGVRFGYAGGLKPENLEEQLAKIASVVGKAEVYIDMESGVRTENKFDLSKVRRCLELASALA